MSFPVYATPRTAQCYICYEKFNVKSPSPRRTCSDECKDIYDKYMRQPREKDVSFKDGK